VHVSGKQRPGLARRAAAVAIALVTSGNNVAVAAAPAEEPTVTPSAGEPAPSPPAETAEVAKAECLARYEEAQVARRERRLLDTRAALRICSGAACPSAIRADCVDWLDQVAHSLPSVVVTARARGADVLAVKVYIDGKLVTERLSGFAFEIDPGLHKFRFESPPWPAIEREVLASEGVKDRHLDIVFAPPLPDPAQLSARSEPPKPFRLERSDYVFGGIALAGFATLAYFGGTGLYDAHHLKTTCMSFCDHDDVQSIRTKLIVADIGMAVGIVALAVGLYLHGKGAF
jgi:hypothetical protein